VNVWLLTIGEPLPTDAGHPRLLRAGLLAEVLASRGHDVTWWTSAFDHSAKSFRVEGEAELHAGPRQSLVLLNGGGYRRNVSLARIRDHERLARRFARRAASCPRPDVIMASFPSIELALEGVRFGRRHGVPVVVDVRDLWPDAMVDLLPRFARPFGELLLSGMRRQARETCAGATAITGNSAMFVRWGLRQAGRDATALDRVFPHGYPATEITDAERARAVEALRSRGVDLSPGRFTALFVGTIGKQFDLDPVIEAARLLGTDPRVQFVIAGAGERLAHYQQAARGLPVVFPGWVNRAEIRVLLGHAGAGLLAYEDRHHWIESTPNKFAEYLSGGVPLLISLRSGEMLEFAREHDVGMSYENSGRRLAERLRELADSPSRAASIKVAAQAAFEQHFRADVVYRSLAEYLERLARDSAATRAPRAR